MKFLFLIFIMIQGASTLASVKTLDEVLEKRFSMANEYTQDLSTVAARDRVRAWLPSSPQISYASNDNHTWRAWTISSSLPIPLKSLYRDKVEVAKRDYLQASASYTKQDFLRDTIEVFLECSIPSEMTRLMDQSLQDQQIISSISNSLYAAGSVPQSDRVAAELLTRQLEAQVLIQKDQATNGCKKWERWADEENADDTAVYSVPTDFSNALLHKYGLATDRYREMTMKQLMSLSVDKERLWSKFVPDLDVVVAKNNYFDLYLSGGPPIKYTYSWSVGITLPFTFPFYDNTEFRRERAQLGLAKMQAEIDRNHADKKWLEAKSDWRRTTARLQQIWSKDLALAEVLVESSLASYRAGRMGFAELVLARRTKLDLKTEEIQLKAKRLLAKTVCLTECEL